MPELPEVETIRSKLVDKIVGLTISNIKILEKKQLIGNVKQIIGKKIIDIQRRGKVLIIKLSNKTSILVHLKMSGQLLFCLKAQIDISKYARVIINFGDGSYLEFNDVRKFGWIKIIQKSIHSTSSGQEIKNQKELANLGPEPFDFAQGKPLVSKEFTKDYLKQIFSKSSKPIKILLLDQEKIAGIGNIYANEALFLAGVHPRKKAKALTKNEIKELHKAIIEVLKRGILHGGSSAEDGRYVQPDGNLGKYQEHFLVYQREGEKCLNNCGKFVKRIELGGRGAFFCPNCQR